MIKPKKDVSQFHNGRKKPEVLAPAGSFDALKAAVYAGADAIYMGGMQFGARAFAENFDEEQLLSAIDFAHLHGCRIYLTVNTLLKEKEIREELIPYLLPFYRRGLDALIVQDFGVFCAVKKAFPDLALHVSTQMGILHEAGARKMKELGAARVVPGRELSLEEIEKLTAIPGLEVECFVHGALCYCYSGQCFLSSRIGGRSGNRGRCAQPCRLSYQLEDGRNLHLLSPKDMMTLDLLPQLCAAGIDSFKIEGRMKKPEYVAAVTKVYRKYVDMVYEEVPYKVEDSDRMLLMQMYNRGGFHEGYYQTHNGAKMMEIRRPNHHGVLIGTIKDIMKNTILFRTEQNLYPGDVIEIRTGKEEITLTCPEEKQAGDFVELRGRQLRQLRKNMPLYRMKSPHLIAQLLEEITEQEKIPITGSCRMVLDTPAEFTLATPDGSCTVTVYKDIVTKAEKQPLTKEQIRKTLGQMGTTEFTLQDMKLEAEEGIFYSVKGLKELRREAVDALKKAMLLPARRQVSEAVPFSFKEERKITPSEKCMVVQVSTREQAEKIAHRKQVAAVIVPAGLLGQLPDDLFSGKEVYVALPHMFRSYAGKEEQYKKQILRSDGILVSSMDAYAFVSTFCQSHKVKKKLIFDDTIYQYNTVSRMAYQSDLAQYDDLTLAYTVLPVELSIREWEALSVTEGLLKVYGKSLMMTSAQCVKKTLGHCDAAGGVTRIKDRKGKTYLVVHHCDRCDTELLEEEPLSLSGCREKIGTRGYSGILLSFTTEQPEQIEAILTAFEKEYLQKREDFVPVSGNRGHAFSTID